MFVIKKLTIFFFLLKIAQNYNKLLKGILMPKPVRCDYTFKLVIAGDTKTGKSNLLSQFIDSKFYSQYELTTGVEFDTKICTESEKTIKLL